MGSRDPSDGKGEGPFYNNPMLEPVVKAYQGLPPISGGCLERSSISGIAGLGMGILYNLVAVPWRPDPVDYFPKGDIKFRDNWKFFRSGFAKPMGIFALTGIAFSGVECLFESIRDPERKAPHWNAFAGGFASGLVLGGLHKRIDYMMVSGVVIGGFMGMLTFSGGRLTNDPHQMAMKVGGKWPKQYKESKELAALKEKYPEYADTY